MRIFRPAHRLALTSILAVLLGACGGGGKGADGLNALTAVSAAGERCEHGGSKIEAGVDVDRNGSLGVNEVTSTHYACDGAGGSTGEPGATLNWVAQSEAVTAMSNTGYIATSTSTLVVTLPDKDHIAVGDVVRVIGAGDGGWKIAQTGAQEVKLASLVDASWTAVGHHARWEAADFSADGKIQVAAVYPAGHIYISIDGGDTWTPQRSNWPSKLDGIGDWAAVACSEDCSRLVAAEWNGSIYAATRIADGSWTWTAEMTGSGPRDWLVADSSNDGGTMAAVVEGGDVYVWTDDSPSPQWTPGNLDDLWLVAVSPDGSTVVAAGEDGAFYVWKKDTRIWTPSGRPAAANRGDWVSVACSRDCNKLVAAEKNGYIYTSTDGGAIWTERESSRYWSSVTSSADGNKLVAVEYDGRAYISIDSGVTWTVAPDEPSRHWYRVVISGDGSTVLGVEQGGQIHVARDGTTPGKDGYISGDEAEAIELIYLGNDQFRVLSHEGQLTIR